MSIYQKRYFCQTLCAFDVKPINLYSQVKLANDVFFFSIELFPSIYILTTSGASHVKWSHETNGELAILLALDSR